MGLSVTKSSGGREAAKNMVQSTAVGAAAEAPVHGNGNTHPGAGFWTLTLGSLGVVYGDIGTSPLYALREAVIAAAGPGELPTRAAVLGVLSLILWALIVVVTLKYVVILLRADNNGEGGTLALMALAHTPTAASIQKLAALPVSPVISFTFAHSFDNISIRQWARHAG